MINVKITSLNEILMTPAIKYNKTKLAKFLKIDRGIINSYLDDINCERHSIICRDGKYIFMSTTRKRTA